MWSKQIDWRSFGALAILCYLVNLFGLQIVDRQLYSITYSYPISLIYALAIFSGALVIADRLKASRMLRFLSTISYSLYLNHHVIGSLLLVILVPTIGCTFALPIAFVGTVGVAYLSWRFVEKPSQGAARELIRRFKLAPLRPDQTTGDQAESAYTAVDHAKLAPSESASS